MGLAWVLAYSMCNTWFFFQLNDDLGLQSALLLTLLLGIKDAIVLNLLTSPKNEVWHLTVVEVLLSP